VRATVIRKWTRFLPLAFALLYLAGPTYLPDYLIYLVTVMTIMAIVTQGLNVMIGFAGQFSFAQPGFMAFGAYFGAILSTRLHGLPFPVTILAVGVASALLGLLIGFPSLRLKGFYLAMATFGFTSAMFELINYLGPLTGGNEGMYAPAPAVGRWELTSTQSVYYIAAISVILIQIAVRHIGSTKTGRAWKAIRDDEIAASSMGIHLTREKLKVFAFGAVLAGISGLYYSYLIRYLETSYFSLMGLSLFLIMVSGGTGTVYGPVLGSIFITLIPQALGGVFSQDLNLVFGIILVLIVLLVPRGFAGLWDRLFGRDGAAFNLRDYLLSRVSVKKANRS